MKPQRSFPIIIAVLLAVALVVLVALADQSKYTVDVELTPEQRTAYEQEIKTWDEKIKAVSQGEKPEAGYFIEKARYQEYLGRYGDAIKTLESAFQYYDNISAAWNNLGRIYDKTGDYKLAIQNYQKLVDVFDLYNYNLDIAWSYYRWGKIEESKKAYEEYKNKTNGRDGELEDYFNKQTMK